MAENFTRVTVAGPQRHVDVLLPSQTPAGLLLPQILELLDDQPASAVAVKTLITPAGDPVRDDTSLSDAGIADGAMLRLVNISEAPPAPVVYDITDAVVEQTEDISGRWTEDIRRATGAVFAAAGLYLGVHLLLDGAATAVAVPAFFGLAAVLLGAGIYLGRATATVLGPLLVGAGWLLALGGVLRLPAGPGVHVLLAAAATAVALVCAGLISQRPRALLSAAGLLALLTVFWAASLALFSEPVQAASVAALLSCATLGLLPQIALSTSGLATLDDRRAKGGRIGRTDVHVAIGSAHRGLSFGTALVALSVAAGLWILGSDTTWQVWTMPLTGCLALATGLRARAFPLATDRIALYLAAAVGTLALARSVLAFSPDQGWLVAAGLLVLAIVVVISLTVTLADHSAAKLRLLANRFETLAILASVPLVIGLFGVFASLLTTFD